jgi:hypothetical protein
MAMLRPEVPWRTHKKRTINLERLALTICDIIAYDSSLCKYLCFVGHV